MHRSLITFKDLSSRQFQFWGTAFIGARSKKQLLAKKTFGSGKKFARRCHSLRAPQILQRGDSNIAHHNPHEWESSRSAVRPSPSYKYEGETLLFKNKKLSTRGWGFAFRMSVVAICVQKWDPTNSAKKKSTIFFFAVPRKFRGSEQFAPNSRKLSSNSRNVRSSFFWFGVDFRAKIKFQGNYSKHIYNVPPIWTRWFHLKVFLAGRPKQGPK